MAIDRKHLPDDPGVLQQMVLDLMAQVDREFTERNKIEGLLRELLDAKRNGKSEHLSADQLALFAAVWQARQEDRRRRRTARTTMMRRAPAGLLATKGRWPAAAPTAPQT